MRTLKFRSAEGRGGEVRIAMLEVKAGQRPSSPPHPNLPRRQHKERRERGGMKKGMNSCRGRREAGYFGGAKRRFSE